MRLRIFQARDGDALLLSHDTNTTAGMNWAHIMIDGGRLAAYRNHIRDHLTALERSGGESEPTIDVLVISHIDADHVEGLVRYTEDLVEWTVHAHLSAQAADDAELAANLEAAAIELEGEARPPETLAFWHNGFSEQFEVNTGPIEDALAALAATVPSLVDPGEEDDRVSERFLALQSGEKQAHHISRRLGPDELGVPQNAPAGGKLLAVNTERDPIDVGGLRFTVLGPTKEELEKLRSDWNKWLKSAEGKKGIAEVEQRADRIREALETDECAAVSAQLRADRPPVDQPAYLRDLALAAGLDLAAAGVMGDAGELSAPNLASLMLLAEVGQGSGTRRMVLTGDGHHLRILDGLKAAGVPHESDAAHVDVLKLPHHGGEYNADPKFFRRLIADHYVICADGSHHNPAIEILDALFDSRLSTDPEKRSPHAKAGDAFELWFATHPEDSFMETRKTARTHLRNVVTHVDEIRANHPGRFEVHWNRGDFIDLDLGVATAASRVWISAVLPNPSGPEAGNEWVEVTNDESAPVDLGGLRIEDRQGGSEPLSGTLAPGAKLRFTIPAASKIRLANSGDHVCLFRGNDELHRVSWTKSKSAVPISGDPPG